VSVKVIQMIYIYSKFYQN